MKTNIIGTNAPEAVMESAIRDYAYHLYLQSGRIPGRDLDNWLEAEALIKTPLKSRSNHRRISPLRERAQTAR